PNIAMKNYVQKSGYGLYVLLTFLIGLNCLVVKAQEPQGVVKTGVTRTDGIRIVGRVSSERGERLDAVTVTEVGTSNSALSEEDGGYILHVLSRAARLNFSAVGYKQLTVDVG